MRKRILSFVLVFALILSLSTMAYAATGPYTYSVVRNGLTSEKEDVSEHHVTHYENIATNIPFSFGAKTRYFDQSQFESSHISGLMQAYRNEGFMSPMTIPAASGTKRVAATEDSGVYGVVLSIYYAKGTWTVYNGNEVSYNGTFANAPWYHTVLPYCFEPIV